MKRNIILLSIVFFGILNVVQSQNITVSEEFPIGDMMKKYTSDNKAQTELAGYRIQLLATTDRQKVERSMNKFKALFPAINVDWEHNKPYYKLRAGAYRTRLDAIRALKTFKKDYPGAYTAKARINKSELL